MEWKRNLDDVNKKEFRNLEEVNLARSECRVQEIAGGAIIFMKDSFFGMTKIDQKGNCKKDHEESDLKKALLFALHFFCREIYYNI
jgi:hypothetical protein